MNPIGVILCACLITWVCWFLGKAIADEEWARTHPEYVETQNEARRISDEVWKKEYMEHKYWNKNENL